MKAAGTVFIFLGPPGAGKGSIAHLAEQELGFITLSTGNLCRRLIAGQTPLGKRIGAVVQAGNLIPDPLMIEMVQQWLNEQQLDGRGVILDGFPRSVEQAQALNFLLKEHFPKLKPVLVHFVIDDATVLERIATRLVCTNKECQQVYSVASEGISHPRTTMVCDRCDAALVRRADDQENAARYRLQLYHAYEAALLDWYRAHQVPIVPLAVDKPLLEVFALFKQQIAGQRSWEGSGISRSTSGTGARLNAVSRRRRT